MCWDIVSGMGIVMSLFNTPKDDKIAYVAKCLNYPDNPITWDKEVIERIINEVEKECHRAFMMACNRLVRRI